MSSTFTLISAILTLILVIDPFGNVPLLLSALKEVEPKRHYRIIARELLIGLAILLVFLFFGQQFLSLFHLETQSITIAGAIIFFVIGLKMIFPRKGDNLYAADGEPLIVPIALPMIAGPSTLATLMVMVKSWPEKQLSLLAALLIAWGFTAVVLLVAPMLYRILRDRGLAALERLMGMLLLIMAVQMFINGLRELAPTFHG